MRYFSDYALPEWFRRHLSTIHLTPTNLKISLILIYFMLLSALYIILVTPPASCYEFSIYSTYPVYFWLLIIASIFFGQICAILCIRNDALRKYWVLGFLAEIVAICLVLFLPMIRGYFIYGSGDVLTHIGYMQDIENFGNIDGNHYPGFHLFGFFMHEFAGLSYGVITMMMPAIFSLIYILYWFIFGRELIHNRVGIVILLIIAALPMVVKGLFTPNSLANLLVPLVIFLIVASLRRSNKYEICLVLILLGVSMVFFHPLATLMLIIISLMVHLYNYILSMHSSPEKGQNKPHLLKIAAIVGILFLTWSTYITFFARIGKSLVTSILGDESTESEFMVKSQLIESVDVDIVYLVKLGLYNYGVEVILGSLVLICVLYLLYLHYMKEEPIYLHHSLFFSIICFMIFSALGITLFFTIHAFNWERIYKFALIFSLIVVSSTFVIVYTRIQSSSRVKKTMFYSSIAIILVLLIYFSVFNFHLSPLMKKEHQQVPAGSYAGMYTFLEYRDPSIPILEHGTTQYRYHHLIYGCKSPNINRYEDTFPLDHFGYNISHNFGTHYDEKQYFLLSEQGRGHYQNMYPEFPHNWRFIDQDFRMLELDVSVIRIYSNDHLEIYLTTPG
jgi:hypothetical protein